MTSKSQADDQINRITSFDDQGEIDDIENDEVCGGLTCPRCQIAVMQYNGLLELTCPNCGFRAPGAAFT